MRESHWNECEAIARKFNTETGREAVLRCDQARHADPFDNEAEHHDPDFGVNWSYDGDEDVRFDD